MENINESNSEIELDPPGIIEKPTEPYAPNNPPWGVPAAILLWLASVALIVIVPLFFVIPYFLSQNVNLSDQEQLANFAQNDVGAILFQIGGIIPAHILTLILAWFVVTKYKKHSFTEMLGWEWGGYKWWHTIVLLLSVFGVALATTSFFGNQDNALVEMLRKSRYIVFLVAILATFSAPIVEEVVYRGILYSAFQKAAGVPVAVALVTLVFALVHYPQYWGDYSTLITLTF